MAKKTKIAEIRADLAATREPPRRTISKLDAIRHLLHGSIRLHFMQEDPFVIHLAAQSCDKLITDLAKHRGLENLNIDHLIAPGMEAKFWYIARETYNYFKHADDDAEEELGVHDIVAVNEMIILKNIGRYLILSGCFDNHCNLFILYLRSFYPDVTKLINISTCSDLAEWREKLRDKTRGEMLEMFAAVADIDSGFQQERRDDLIDARTAAQEKLLEE